MQLIKEVPAEVLQAAKRTQLLDTPPEHSFDRLTRLTAKYLNAATSLVTVFDSDRQFFKSHYGLPQPFCEIRQTPIGESICLQVVCSGEPLVLGDATREPPFSEIPISPDLPVVAYLGVPLKLHGDPFGTLCVFDGKPRVWSEDHLEFVVEMAESICAEVELREKTMSLEQAQNRLEELVRKQNEFMGMAAHDLRTPLTVVLGYGKLLASDRKNLQPQEKKMVEAICSRGQFMLSLINDLLDLEALKSGLLRLDLERISLPEFLESLVEMNRFLSEPKGIELQYQAPQQPHHSDVLGDARKLEQVFNNLLSNAIKFSPGGTKVEVVLQRVDSRLRITVVDQGPGIAPERQATLFEPFTRGESHGQKGTGLGLSIAKRIVEGHHGTLSLESALGQGSRFQVDLPLAPEV